MPNWCGNRLTAAGDRALLAELRAAVAGTDGDGEPMVISFESIDPTPAEELIDGDRLNSWHDFHWGTKWDALPDSIWIDEEAKGGKFVVHFWTAWSPPVVVLDLLASRFPGLDFELVYNESDCGLAGYRLWAGGQHIEYDEVYEAEDAVPLLRRFDWESEASEWIDDYDEEEAV